MDLALSSKKKAFQVRQNDQFIEIEGRGYRLKVSLQQPEVDLFLGNRFVTTLNMASALDTTDAFDDKTELDRPVLRHESPEKAVIGWQGHSARWSRKEVELEAWNGGFSYHYTVYGEGALDRAFYWRNHRSGSQAHAVRLFNPEPNSRAVRYTGERCWKGTACYVCYPEPGQVVPPDYMTISVGRDKNYHGGNWFFTPAPFCYAIEGEANWLALGIAARPGEWNFSDYTYPGDGFGFSLVYDGHTRVKGHWQSPAMLCLVAPDEYSAIENYCGALRAGGMAPDHGRGAAQSWWREPIFCGWGEQISQEVHLGGLKAPDRATQLNYQEWMRLLDEHQINPGMIVIDDKWQLNYGLNDVDPAKWPDMAGFIAQQHRQGRRVLLWLKAWDPQGVPAAECITDEEGNPVAVDPGNPKFRERLAGQVTRMLSELGADGFKIDFTHLIPRGPALDQLEFSRFRDERQGLSGGQPLPRAAVSGSTGGKWGLELMREWLQIVSDGARAAHPDAVIITHTANPYLADLVDVLRLNDVAGLEDIYASIVPDMQHRTRIARAASPYWLLDSDNWPCSSRKQWYDYIQAQKDGQFGIPALYHIERLGWGAVNEALDEEDFRAIRESWKTYRATLVMENESNPEKASLLQT
jgi:hypothetical protein